MIFMACQGWLLFMHVRTTYILPILYWNPSKMICMHSSLTESSIDIERSVILPRWPESSHAQVRPVCPFTRRASGMGPRLAAPALGPIIFVFNRCDGWSCWWVDRCDCTELIEWMCCDISRGLRSNHPLMAALAAWWSFLSIKECACRGHPLI